MAGYGWKIFIIKGYPKRLFKELVEANVIRWDKSKVGVASANLEIPNKKISRVLLLDRTIKKNQFILKNYLKLAKKKRNALKCAKWQQYDFLINKCSKCLN